MTNRRNFLCKCAAASFMGITVSMNSDTSAKGLLGKNRSFCSVQTDQVHSSTLGKKKWSRTNLRYWIAARDTNELEAEVWDSELKLAFDAWSEITPLNFEKVEATEEFDLIVSVGNRRRESFGRRGGVLAWAQMPPTRNYDGILLTKFDTAENSILPSEENGIIFRSVACHEIGHLLGLPHSDDKNALMYAYINDALKPQKDDIKQIQRLYGTRP